MTGWDEEEDGRRRLWDVVPPAHPSPHTLMRILRSHSPTRTRTRVTQLTIQLNPAAVVGFYAEPSLSPRINTEPTSPALTSQRSRFPSSGVTEPTAITSMTLHQAHPGTHSLVWNVRLEAVTWLTGWLGEACAPGELRPDSTPSDFSWEEWSTTRWVGTLSGMTPRYCTVSHSRGEQAGEGRDVPRACDRK